MKRILSVTLAALFLLPLLLLPASAAELKEYVFEYVEPVMTLDLDFENDGSSSAFRCYESIPEGYYYAILDFGVSNFGKELIYTSAPFLLSWTVEDIMDVGNYVRTSYFFASPVLFDKILNENHLVQKDVYLDLDYIFTDFSDGREDSFQVYLYIKLKGSSSTYIANPDYTVTLVPCLSPALMNLTDSISSNPNALLSYIVSLLPLVFPVCMSFLGIRKAISYVRSKVSQT